MSLPEQMSAIVADGPGGPGVLHLEPVPIPQPAPGEVLIKVAAAGVNAPDLAQRRGAYPPPPGASPLLGLEVSGEIVMPAGEWKAGDKVMALCNGGGYAEYVAVSAGQVLPAPDNWALTDAAALPEGWFTITQTLVMRAGLSAGMSVLVTGAAGGLGGAAIQIAKILGADPIAIVYSTTKASYVTGLGARAVIRRDIEDLAARIRELTDGKGVDRIVDMVGGETTPLLVESLARYGHLVVVATLAGPRAQLPLSRILGNQLTVSGSTLRPQTAETKAAIAQHVRAHLWPALSDPGFPRSKLTKFPLSRAADAHRAMEEPGHYGKMILLTDFGNR
jgi:putative PIG3 family NAD(P)H quinone oxidoreductase